MAGLELKAVRVQQRDVTLILTVIPAGELLKRARVDMWEEGNPEGYQRALVDGRLRKVADYLMVEEGVLPTSVLVNVRDGDELKFKVTDKSSGYEVGTLRLPDEQVLWVVDGQHRLYGLKRAIDAAAEEEKYEQGAELADYPFPVTFMVGLDRYKEMRHFYLVNTRQKGVPTDYVDRHLYQMYKKAGPRLIRVEGEAGYARARATEMVDSLRKDPESPWHNLVIVPGGNKKSKGAGLTRQHAIVASLQPVFADRYIRGLRDEKVAGVLKNYWAAIKDLMPDAFKHPQEYGILKTVGIYSLHMVLPDVIERCRDAGDFSKDKMAEVLRAVGKGMQNPKENPVDSEFWHKDRGNPMTFGTSMKGLRYLAEYIRERLPEVKVPGA